MSAAPMIEIRGVSKFFAGHAAVENIDLLVRKGEFLTLLGPSGCGKSTLLRVVGGFELPSAGRVILNGTDVTDLPPYRRDVNMVFQSYALFPHLSVRNNVAFGLKMKKVARAEIEERVATVLEMAGLAGLEARKPDQLSGGQRQRVALARAVVCRPKVLLLDEPLAALDASLRAQMRVELKELQRKLGITFVFVTHDQEEALVMSDRIAVMRRGKVEQLAPPEEIYREPATAFVRDFVGDMNRIEAVIKKTAGGFKAAADSAVEFDVPGVVPEAEGSFVSLLIRPEKIRVAEKPGNEGAWFEAVVEEEYFLGPSRKLKVRAGRQLVLTVLTMEQTGRKEERIWCGIQSGDLVREAGRPDASASNRARL